MLLRQFPVETCGITHFLQAPGIKQLHIGIRCQSQSLLIVFYLQAAAQHVFTLAIIGMRLTIVRLRKIAPTLIDGVFRTIGVLPAFTKREFPVTELLTGSERDAESVACAPVFSAFLRFPHLSIAIEHSLVCSIVIADFHIIIV